MLDEAQTGNHPTHSRPDDPWRDSVELDEQLAAALDARGCATLEQLNWLIMSGQLEREGLASRGTARRLGNQIDVLLSAPMEPDVVEGPDVVQVPNEEAEAAEVVGIRPSGFPSDDKDEYAKLLKKEIRYLEQLTIGTLARGDVESLRVQLDLDPTQDRLFVDLVTTLRSLLVGQAHEIVEESHAHDPVPDDEVDMDIAQVMALRRELDRPMSPDSMGSVGETTLQRLGEPTVGDFIQYSFDALVKLPGVGKLKARRMIEQANKLKSELIQRFGNEAFESLNVPTKVFTSTQGARTHGLLKRLDDIGIDAGLPWRNLLVHTNVRIQNALELHEVETLGQVIDLYESGELSRTKNVGKSSFEVFGEQLALLAEHGIDRYLFGEEGQPVDLPDLVERAMESFDEIDRQMVILRYRDRRTLQEVGERFNLTRERVRQRVAKVLDRSRLVFDNLAETMLKELIDALDANHGVLELSTALELSPGDEFPWQIVFVLDMLERDARVVGTSLLVAGETDACEALRKRLLECCEMFGFSHLDRQDLEQVRDMAGLELSSDAMEALVEEFDLLEREEDGRWKNRRVNLSNLYARILQSSGDPMTLKQIAEARQEHQKLDELPELRAVYTVITRTDEIVRLERGLYLHQDHLPVPLEDLTKIVDDITAMVVERGEVVNMTVVHQNLVDQGRLPEQVTTGMLHHLVARRDNIYNFTGGTMEVAPADSGLKRMTLADQVIEVLRMASTPLSPQEIIEQIPDDAYTNEGSILGTLSADGILSLGTSAYTHLDHMGLPDGGAERLVEHAVSCLPVRDVTGPILLLEKLDSSMPEVKRLGSMEAPERWLWGLLRTDSRVSTGPGMWLARASFTDSLVEAVFHAFVAQLDVGTFFSKDFYAFARDQKGYLGHDNPLRACLKAAREAGIVELVEPANFLYRVSTADLGNDSNKNVRGVIASTEVIDKIVSMLHASWNPINVGDFDHRFPGVDVRTSLDEHAHPDILNLGRGFYLHRTRTGLSLTNIEEMKRFALEYLPREGFVSARELLLSVPNHVTPAVGFLRQHTRGPEILWGLLHTHENVITREDGLLVARFVTFSKKEEGPGETAPDT